MAAGLLVTRAAAKNYKNVLVLCDPADYGLVLTEMQNPRGVSDELRHRLAVKAFSHTAHYDAVISSHLRTRWEVKDKFAEETTSGLRKIKDGVTSVEEVLRETVR